MTDNPKRRSSLFARARSSFFRSGRERGADVETLRGNSGSDFEGDAEIWRGGDGSFTCTCLAQSSKPKSCYILVKGPAVFVFSTQSSPSPKYAIKLDKINAKVHQGHEKHVLVTLESVLGDVEFRVFLNEKSKATDFAKAVKKQAAVAQDCEAKTRLGHHHLLNKRASMKYAECIALEMEKEQPKKPTTYNEILPDIQQVAY